MTLVGSRAQTAFSLPLCWWACLAVVAWPGAFMAHAALFGPLKQLNTNAKYDKGDDYQPRIATDDQGNWVAVWTSKDMYSPSQIICT